MFVIVLAAQIWQCGCGSRRPSMPRVLEICTCRTHASFSAIASPPSMRQPFCAILPVIFARSSICAAAKSRRRAFSRHRLPHQQLIRRRGRSCSSGNSDGKSLSNANSSCIRDFARRRSAHCGAKITARIDCRPVGSLFFSIFLVTAAASLWRYQQPFPCQRIKLPARFFREVTCRHLISRLWHFLRHRPLSDCKFPASVRSDHIPRPSLRK